MFTSTYNKQLASQDMKSQSFYEYDLLGWFNGRSQRALAQSSPRDSRGAVSRRFRLICIPRSFVQIVGICCINCSTRPPTKRARSRDLDSNGCHFSVIAQSGAGKRNSSGGQLGRIKGGMVNTRNRFCCCLIVNCEKSK